MKQPLIFKGDDDYVYASGVVRGLEPYILKKADYQKLMDTENRQIRVVLSEFGYGGGERNPEHALDSATERLFKQINKLAPEDEFIHALQLRYDFQNAAIILKARLFEKEPPQLIQWGTIPHDEIIRQIDFLLSGEKSDLPEILANGILKAKNSFSLYNSAMIMDMALDSFFAAYLRGIFPVNEYFSRWMAIYADWLNTKAVVRTLRAEIPVKPILDMLIPGGDIGDEKFIAAAEAEMEHIRTIFSSTEYGRELSDAIAAAMKTNSAALDLFFRTRLIAIYRYTQYCSYGEELIWAYALVQLEEIGALRTILRAKAANIPMDAVKEVISIVME